MGVVRAQAQITEAIVTWQGIQALPHRFGGTEYRLGDRREIGHIHGDTMIDIPFPTAVRKELVEAGRAQPHHLLPESGWISFYIRQPEDIVKAIALFKLSYDIAQKQLAPKA